MLLSMGDELTRSTFDGIWEFSAKMDNAIRRCTEIAKGESAMGYADSAKAYDELVSELRAVKGWQHEVLQSTIQVFSDLWHTYMIL